MYASGMFDFPTVTGDFSVTGLGFEPQGVIMIYGNKATVGTLLTGLTGPGIGISMNALDWSSPGTILSLGLSPNGNSDANNANYRGIETGPISMQTDAATASVVDYKASAITFDVDGFTLTVSTAAGGVRPVHWFAWGGDIDIGTSLIPMQTACVKQQMSGSPTFDAGFEAWSAMVVSTVATNGFGEGNVDGSAWYSFGTGHYPELSVGDAQKWASSVLATQIQLTSALGRQGWTDQFVLSGPGAGDWSFVSVSNVVNALGPLLVEGFRRHRPEAEISSQQIYINEGGGAGTPWQDAIWWNSEGWTDFVTIPAGGSVTVNHPWNFEDFEQVMFSTINGGATSAPLRFGFGMLGYDDQGCVVFGQDGSFYQSNDECAANCTAGGYSAASGVINGSSFTLTSTNADLGDLLVVWHGWGRPRSPAQWIPHIYRMVRSITTTRGTAPVVLHGYLLLEDGDKIILEDGSGFLKLG